MYRQAHAMVAMLLTAMASSAAWAEPADLFADPEAWWLVPELSWRWDQRPGDGATVLTLHEVGPAKLEPVRRPFTTAVYEGQRWSTATIDVEVKSLEPSARVGRDVCVLLGYEDDTHYTYVHVSNDADGRVHNVIMKVDGNERRMIQSPPRPEPRLRDGWQRVRVTFNEAGKIAVYMDDFDTPLMTATDADLPGGRVGIATFNDRAAFAAFAIDGEPATSAR
ncbi:MAG: hypothetical protein AAGK09_10245 [Planctomycetota bacterium]